MDKNYIRRHRAWVVLLNAAAVCCTLSWAPLGDGQVRGVGPKPADAPAKWKAIIGTYARDDKKTMEVLEENGALNLKEAGEPAMQIQEDAHGNFSLKRGSEHQPLHFVSDGPGGIKELVYANGHFTRQNSDADTAKSFRITPVRPIEELRKEALAAQPPDENKEFRKSELKELGRMDPSIHLDIRYAGTNNFLGTAVYTQARAFLQRPAAEALVRASQNLKALGYGLLIHDGYRPWYVTKIFWDATPAEGKIFVANPADGSRHNRGCAVDVSLYDLKTGLPVEMPGTYDEMSPRSFPNYPGGTSLQRWHRELLRHAMEAEGFSVYETEWWHFDYKDWKEYPILNITFERLGASETSR